MDGTDRKKRYMELLEVGMQLYKDVDNTAMSTEAIDDVTRLISESDKLNKIATASNNVNNSAEVVMDAQVLKMGHEIIGKIVDKARSSSFDVGEYCTAINNRRSQYHGGKWETIDNLVAKYFAIPSYTCSLYGSFDMTPAQMPDQLKNRKKGKRLQVETLTVPESLSPMSENKKGTEKLNLVLSQIRKICSNRNTSSVPYFELIIDPSDFMKTVDNALQIAFLVSNKSIMVETDNNEMPTVRIRNTTDVYAMSSTPCQAVSSLTTRIVQDMIKFYDIKRPLLE